MDMVILENAKCIVGVKEASEHGNYQFQRLEGIKEAFLYDYLLVEDSSGSWHKATIKVSIKVE